ncbi:unnamed protein product [Paramecium sonneborni]|uniref:Uncharacterized protein n=1 Tax=Paramecium sonneborni TaxID=65129 RepID=A0A8S1QK39_9CILI|nr:unnamed protein product [Paramecium sonneborni]
MDQLIAQLGEKQKGIELAEDVENNKDMSQFIEVMKKIMKEKHPPKECVYGLKIVKDCIEKFNNDFKNKVKNELMELIYEVAIYRIKDVDDSRGITYFKNPEHEKQIEQYGASYIRLALDCIRVWSLWFPDFKIYGQRLEKEQGYLPKINYFKQELIDKHIPKLSTTPYEDSGLIQNKIRQLNQQLITYLQSHTEVNSFLKDELEKINIQIEDLVVQEVQDQFLDEFVLSYPEFQNGRISYQEFRMQFLTNQQIKKSSQNFQDESNLTQSIHQTSKIMKPQQQQNQQIFQQQDQSQIFKNEDHNKEIENLQLQLKSQKLENEKLVKVIQSNENKIQELQNELQQQKVQTENLKNKFQNDSLNYERQLEGLQQKMNHYKNLFESSLQQVNQEQRQQDNQQQQQSFQQQQQQEQQSQTIQNLQEELENLKVEKNLLIEQQKIYQERGNSNFSEFEYMNLKKKYDNLDSKYFLLKQENYKLKQTCQEYGSQSINQSRINESFAAVDQKDVNSNIVFYNFKESDLWQTVNNTNQNQTMINSRLRDVSELIYPHKTAAEYYKQNGKKEFKGNLINRSELQLQLNQINLLNYKKASLNQIAALFQSNKIEIKSRQQLIYGQNKQEFISTTISIKNKELRSIQLQIINSNKNVWINKDTKSTLLQSQQSILYEFIREANVKLHEQTLIKLSISFENFVIYLPNFLMNCIKFYSIEASSFKTMKKQFQGKIYASPLLPICCKAELKQLSEQGQLLNQWEQENEDLITQCKYGFKAVLSNQLEFYLELIMTPCDEFLFRGFTSFDEETLQFVLNGLSNLYS